MKSSTVTRIITIGTSVESSRGAVALADKYPNVFAVMASDGAFKSKQASLFEQQLSLAVELGLNVVILNRRSVFDHRPFSTVTRSYDKNGKVQKKSNRTPAT